MRQENLKQKQLAELVGTTPQSVNNWLKRNSLSRESAQAICEKLGYSLNWLLEGIGNAKIGEGSTFRESELKVTEWIPESADESEFVVVPYLNIRLSAGSGAYNEYEEEMYSLPFRKHTLQRLGINPNNVKVVRVIGDSMEPKLSDGDTVAINMADKAIRDGKMYAVRIGDFQRVKILIEQPGGIVIKSLNRDFEDEVITPSRIESGEFSVIGRVWWISSLV